MDDTGAYLPSPTEIAAACQVIQRAWTDDERQRRRWGLMPGSQRAKGVAPPDPWSLPVVPVPAEAAAMLESA